MWANHSDPNTQHLFCLDTSSLYTPQRFSFIANLRCVTDNPEGSHVMSFKPLTRLLAIVCLFVTGVLIIGSAKWPARAQNSTTGASQQMMKTNSYPVARKGDQVDDYHGVKSLTRIAGWRISIPKKHERGSRLKTNLVSVS